MPGEVPNPARIKPKTLLKAARRSSSPMCKRLGPDRRTHQRKGASSLTSTAPRVSSRWIAFLPGKRAEPSQTRNTSRTKSRAGSAISSTLSLSITWISKLASEASARRRATRPLIRPTRKNASYRAVESASLEKMALLCTANGFALKLTQSKTPKLKRWRKSKPN